MATLLGQEKDHHRHGADLGQLRSGDQGRLRLAYDACSEGYKCGPVQASPETVHALSATSCSHRRRWELGFRSNEEPAERRAFCLYYSHLYQSSSQRRCIIKL